MSSENEILAIQEPKVFEVPIEGPPLLEHNNKVIDKPESQTLQDTGNEESTKEILISFTNKLIESTVSLLDNESKDGFNSIKKLVG